MSGEKNIDKLLRHLSPELIAGEFIFCSFEKARYGDHSELEPIGCINEREGLTLVVAKPKADEYGLNYESVFRCITLNIHSSLDAIGLTAAFSTKLTECGISSNVIAGYFHDHVFVQADLAEKALAAIKELIRL